MQKTFFAYLYPNESCKIFDWRYKKTTIWHFLQDILAFIKNLNAKRMPKRPEKQFEYAVFYEGTFIHTWSGEETVH